MTNFQSNEEFFAALRQQIERWCDQRRLRELALLLPGYTSFFGLTDDWARFYKALKEMDQRKLVIALVGVGAFAVPLAVTAAVKVTIDRRREKRRRTGLEEVGIRMGLRYEREPQPQRQDESEWLLFGWTEGPARNILLGAAAGTEVVIFDSNIRGRRTLSRTVAAYRLHSSVPEFELWRNVGIRRLLGSRAMEFIEAVHHINFGSNQDFSDRYVVRGQREDEQAIRAFFNPEMREYFVSLDRNNNYHVATGDGWIGFCKWEKMPKPEAVPAFLDETSAMYSAIKSHMSGSALAEGV